MEVQYDPAKNRVNIRKHGISLADADGVLFDPMGITLEDPDHNEYRYITIGMDIYLRILVVAWGDCGEDCYRLISARKAQPNEIKQYEG